MPSVTARIPDSLRVSGYIPDPINTHAKARLAAILTREGLTLVQVPLREISVHANFWLNAADAQRLAELGQPHGLSVGEVVTALLQIDARQVKENATKSQPSSSACPAELQQALNALGLSERVEQTRFYRAISTHFARQQIPDRKVLFAEAGTGTGKTLAYLVAAHQIAADESAGRIAIAVPSHALMDKVMHDWQALATGLDEPIGNVTALLSQAEFVSLQSLQWILDEVHEIETRDQVSEWMAQGGPAPANWLIQHRWTMAGLRSAAPAFGLLDSVSLDSRETDDDPGLASYQSQWHKIAQSRVIFMTHAMLASLTWRRLMAQGRAHKDSQQIREAIASWSATPGAERELRLYEVINAIYASMDDPEGHLLLPDLDMLIVDEAHQLDDAFALVLSRTFSVWALRRDVQSLHVQQPSIVKRADVQALESIWSCLKSFGDGGQSAVGDEIAGVIAQLSQVLGVMCGRRRARCIAPAVWRRVDAIANSLRISVAAQTKAANFLEVMVRWSPDRQWPQLTIGRLSYAREMHYLWTAVAARACLVSGTLYEELPQVSCEASRRALNVPFDNVVQMEPVHAPWQYTPVTVCMIGAICTAGGRPRYLRPKAADDPALAGASAAIAHDDWARDVAHYMLQAYRDGSGGMLALGTAFKDLHAIAQHLRSAAGIDLVLEHRAGISLATLREQFLSNAESGGRPILLAAGGAWTGFDLHSERNPNACTDLVIINAPFGATARTLAREARLRQNRGFAELSTQVTVLVRQGIGRLVRSPNTPKNRRIHWLDARIHQPNFAGLLNPVKRVFAKYRQITVG